MTSIFTFFYFKVTLTNHNRSPALEQPVKVYWWAEERGGAGGWYKHESWQDNFFLEKETGTLITKCMFIRINTVFHERGADRRMHYDGK